MRAAFFPFCLFACLLFYVRPALAQETRLAPVTVGRVTAAWDAPNGLSVAFDGVPFVRRTTLVIARPDWSGTHPLYQNGGAVMPVVSGWKKARRGDDEQTATVTLETTDARADYYFSVDSGGVTVDIAYRLKRDFPAVIEYAHILSGPVLQGARASSLTRGGVTIPVVGASSELSQEKRRILSPFRDLTFSTRLGQLSVLFSGNAPQPVLFDGRGDENVPWAGGFWMGLGSPSPPITFRDGVRRARFRFSFTPDTSQAPLADTLDKVFALPFTAGGDIAVPAAGGETPLILPRPKEMEAAPAFQAFRITMRTRILVRDRATAEERRGARLLQQEIKARFGRVVPIKDSGNLKSPEQAILMAEVPRATGSLRRILEGLPPDKPEGYAIAVSPQTVLVAGSDTPGLLWGAQTVIQLLAADATGPIIRPAIIHDWPSLAVRGVHLFHGQNALPFHEKLIDRVLSRFKMNTLLLQVEQAKWDTDPLVAPSWGGSKADLAAEVAYARERGMTAYPLVQGYGHMEWLFNKKGNRDYAEDPETPYAVNFTNPAAVRYLTRFVDEADTLFDAPAFHVGLDEIDMRGRFPYRSLPRTKPELIAQAARYWRNHLKARGKETWMWADMVMSRADVAPSWANDKMTPQETAALRAQLPKDMTLIDWQYSPRDTYPSLTRLKESGFTSLIAATWYNLEGNRLFAKAAADAGARGAIITTWAGYESKESVLATPERRQFTAMVAAADYFWNGGDGPKPADLPYSPDAVFARQWADPDPAQIRVRAGFTLFLADAANRVLPDWLGEGAENSPAADFPVNSLARLDDGTQYRFASGPLLLAGKLNPPSFGRPFPLSVNLLLPRPARELRLLLTATHRAAPGTKVGTLTVTRTGGKTETVDLIYGTNIAALTDKTDPPQAVSVWRGRTAAGQATLLRRVTVAADKSDISSVTLTSANTETAPALFAVSGLTH